MSDILKTVLSLSLSGSILIIVLFACKFLVKNTIKKRWQYYIWLIVLVRLLLPFTPKINLMKILSEETNQITDLNVSSTTFENNVVSSPDIEHDSVRENKDVFKEIPMLFNTTILIQWLGVFWLGVMSLLLVRKITMYQSFINYIRAGCDEVSDIKQLNHLARIGEQMGVKRPVELYTNKLISSPFLFGFFKPCIVLPTQDLSEIDFQYIIQHELIHYKRKDTFYKWLVQVTCCIHWFNPLVWLMEREINHICELACDEALLQKLNDKERHAYGDMLMRAMVFWGGYQNSSAVMLNKGAKLLKERLYAIMNFKKSSSLLTAISLIFIIVLMMGGTVLGATISFNDDGMNSQVLTSTKYADNEKFDKLAEQYYADNNIAFFIAVFAQLNEESQAFFLEKIYKDNNIAFFSACLLQLDIDNDLTMYFAQKAYEDENVTFFSVCTQHMSESTLESWFDKAIQEQKVIFYSIVSTALDRDFDKEEQREELDTQLNKEYSAFGIIKDKNSYYYQDQLVRVFLDHQPNTSFYGLSMNPIGTVNIKIIRDENGKITGVDYITETEMIELFGEDWEDESNRTDPFDLNEINGEKITIPVEIHQIKNKEIVWLGTYHLDWGDQVYYEVSAATGERLTIGFKKAGQEEDRLVGTMYNCVSYQRMDGKLEINTNLEWEDTIPPGEYSLFVYADGSDLADVKGNIIIIK